MTKIESLNVIMFSSGDKVKIKPVKHKEKIDKTCIQVFKLTFVGRETGQ